MKSLLGLLLIGGISAAAQEIEAGAKIFASRCAGCHGADGAGGEHGPTIVDLGRRGGGGGAGRNGQALRDTIKNGIKEGGMPAFDLPDPEMTSLVAFIGVLRAPAAGH